MRLATEFIKLPFTFDKERLREEALAISPSLWVSHPMEKDNMAVILVSVNAGTNDEFGIAGQMGATTVLQQCPYIRQVLGALSTPISRTRLMIIGPKSSCPLHDDLGYHWYRRTRIHIPIITNPGVQFSCNGKSVHMAAGECWTFDNFLPHSVVNDGEEARIHLVVDTKGSPSFWKMIGQAVRMDRKCREKYIGFEPSKSGEFEVEQHFIEMLTPEEFELLCEEILGSVKKILPDRESQRSMKNLLHAYSKKWRRLFTKFGHSQAGVDEYSRLLDEFNESSTIRLISGLINRYEPGGNALEILRTVFQRTNRQVEYAPDTEVLNLAWASLQKKKAS